MKNWLPSGGKFRWTEELILDILKSDEYAFLGLSQSTFLPFVLKSSLLHCLDIEVKEVHDSCYKMLSCISHWEHR